MIRIYIFAVLFFALLPGRVIAQHNLTGMVKGEKGDPLDGVTVYVQETGAYTWTDGAGEFAIEVPGEGLYRVHFQYLGYEEFVRTLEGGDRRDLEVRLSPAFLGLPEVVVSGSSLTGGMLHPEKNSGSGHYIGPEQLRAFAYSDVHRVLQNIPGVQLRGEDGWGLRPNIGIRGSGSERSSRIALMEDGILIAPAPYSAPAAYYFPVIGKMHALELAKGSDNIRFGPFTTGGALNMITRPVPSEFSAGASLGAGSFGFKDLHFYVGEDFGRIGLIAEAYRVQSDGFKELDNGGETGFRKNDYSVKLRYQNSSGSRTRHILEAKAAYAEEDSDETYLGLAKADFDRDPLRRYFASARDNMRSDHQQFYLRYIMQPLAGWQLQVTAYRNEFSRNWYKLDKVRTPDGEKEGIAGVLADPLAHPVAMGLLKGMRNDGELLVKANNRAYLSEGLQAHWSHSWTTGAGKVDLLGGIRWHYDEMDRFQWVDEYREMDGALSLTHPGEPGTESNRIQSAHALAGFAEVKWKFGKWTLSPGLRVESVKLRREDYGKEDPERSGTDLQVNENRETALIPALGLVYRLSEKHHLFGGVHKGFAPPGTTEGSKAESSLNYEIGYYLKTGSSRIQAALFWNDYSNLLGSDLAASGGSGSGELFNGGEATVRGLELEATHTIQWGQSAFLSSPLSMTYTYTDPRFDSSFESEFDPWGKVDKGDRIPYVPTQQFSFTGGLSAGPVTLLWSQTFTDEMLTVAGDETDAPSLDPYWLSDLSIRGEIRKGFSLMATVHNLFDNKYALSDRPAGLRPGLPRFFRLGLDIKL